MNITRVVIGNTLEFAATFFDQYDAAIVPQTVQVFLRQGTQLDTEDLVAGANGVWTFALDTALYAKGLLNWSVKAVLTDVVIRDDGVFNLVGNSANTN